MTISEIVHVMGLEVKSGSKEKCVRDAGQQSEEPRQDEYPKGEVILPICTSKAEDKGEIREGHLVDK